MRAGTVITFLVSGIGKKIKKHIYFNFLSKENFSRHTPSLYFFSRLKQSGVQILALDSNAYL